MDRLDSESSRSIKMRPFFLSFFFCTSLWLKLNRSPPTPGIGGVPLHSGGQQDHLRQGGPAGWHHQLPEAQRPQRPAQRLVAQTQLAHVAGQQDHAPHRQGGDDPQPAVKAWPCSALLLFFWFCLFAHICTPPLPPPLPTPPVWRCFWQHTVYWWTVQRHNEFQWVYHWEGNSQPISFFFCTVNCITNMSVHAPPTPPHCHNRLDLQMLLVASASYGRNQNSWVSLMVFLWCDSKFLNYEFAFFSQFCKRVGFTFVSGLHLKVASSKLFFCSIKTCLWMIFVCMYMLKKCKQ